MLKVDNNNYNNNLHMFRLYIFCTLENMYFDIDPDLWGR